MEDTTYKMLPKKEVAKLWKDFLRKFAVLQEKVQKATGRKTITNIVGNQRQM